LLLLLTIEYTGVQFAAAGVHWVDSCRPTTRRCQVSKTAYILWLP